MSGNGSVALMSAVKSAGLLLVPPDRKVRLSVSAGSESEARRLNEFVVLSA